MEEGAYLVTTARSTVESFLTEGRRRQAHDVPPRFREKRGAFVTIRTHPAGELRGCIGRPYPSEPLIDAVRDSAADAALNDPRFDAVTASELPSLTFEVSILTEPEHVVVRSPLDLKKAVVIGRDGVIVEWRGGSGLLLPQVPVEEKWDIDAYLSYACMKAGATPDLWLSNQIRLYSFQAVVFGEAEPSGQVRKIPLATQ